MSGALVDGDAQRLQECVAGGGVAVFPTDTVYGLCCDPQDEAAARRLYALKGRPPARACAVMFFSLEPALQTLEQLREAELHFHDGPLEGLKLIGFSIWERRGSSGRNVTFPARSYSVNGERRSFALLRPVADTTAQDVVRDLILSAYAEYEQSA